MTQSEIDEFVRTAEEVYETRLRSGLEQDHADEFVAIEPESGQFFLGKTLNEATRAARNVFPNRMTHAIRVGHIAAIYLC